MPQATTGRLRTGLALLVAVTMFMEQLDGTILVTAAPQIAADFGMASADINIAMTAYLITVATLIPLGGWLTARLGARRVYCAAIAVFTVASLLCALSPDLTMLTIGRVLQGAAGAMMVPVGRLVVLRGADKSELLRTIAFITWPALIAPVLAPVLGGVITTYASWHWIFLINLPLGAAALAAAWRLVPRSETGRPEPMDWPGLLWSSIAVFALIAGMELASGSPYTALALGTVAAAAVVGCLAVRHLLRAQRPLLDLRIFRVPTFRVTNSGGFVYRLVIGSAPFLLPLLFQDGFGWSPVESGLLVMAVFIGNVGIKPVTTPLLRRLGFKAVLAGSVTGGLLCFSVFATLTPHTPTAVIVGILVISGAFRSIGFTAYNSIQFADVESERMGPANTLSSAVGQLGSALGIGVGALVLRQLQLAFDAGSLLPYRWTFGVMAALMLLPLIGSLRLPRGAAGHVTAGPDGQKTTPRLQKDYDAERG